MGVVLQAGRAQGHRLRALLLPLRRVRAAQVRPHRMEQRLPLQPGRPLGLHRRGQQLPRQLIQGAPSVPGYASLPSPPCAPAPLRPGTTAPRHHGAPAPLCPCARRSRRARAPDVPLWPHTGALGRLALHLWRDHVRRAHHRQQGPAAVLGVPEHLPARGAARVAPVLPVVRGAAAARARAVPRVHRGAPRHRDARRLRAAHQLGDQLHDAAGTPAPTPDP